MSRREMPNANCFVFCFAYLRCANGTGIVSKMHMRWVCVCVCVTAGVPDSGEVSCVWWVWAIYYVCSMTTVYVNSTSRVYAR